MFLALLPQKRNFRFLFLNQCKLSPGQDLRFGMQKSQRRSPCTKFSPGANGPPVGLTAVGQTDDKI
jgi:hypothetical protein